MSILFGNCLCPHELPVRTNSFSCMFSSLVFLLLWVACELSLFVFSLFIWKTNWFVFLFFYIYSSRSKLGLFTHNLLWHFDSSSFRLQIILTSLQFWVFSSELLYLYLHLYKFFLCHLVKFCSFSWAFTYFLNLFLQFIIFPLLLWIGSFSTVFSS